MRHVSLAARVLVGMALLAACDAVADGRRVDGSGTITTEVRQVAAFERITLAGEGDVIVAEGGDSSLTVETDDNLLAHIETSVVDGTLEIATASGIDLDPTDSITYRVTTPTVSGVTLSGAGSFTLERCEAEAFSVVLSGAGDIRIGELSATSLDVAIAGAGSVAVAGEVASQRVSLPGAGSYDGAALESARADVTASGVGSAVVWVTGELDATLTGVGNIEYIGSPQVSQSISGVGAITRRDA